MASSLLNAAAVYVVQKDYAKAEAYLLRALNIDESLYGHDGLNLPMPLASVCSRRARKTVWPEQPATRFHVGQRSANPPESGPHERGHGREDRLASIRSLTMQTHTPADLINSK